MRILGGNEWFVKLVFGGGLLIFPAPKDGSKTVKNVTTDTKVSIPLALTDGLQEAENWLQLVACN